MDTNAVLTMLADEPQAQQQNTQVHLLPAGYVLTGGTGVSALPLAFGNGGAMLVLDGASDPLVPTKAASRYHVVETPRVQFRDYIPLVREMSNVFHPNLITALQFSVGGDDRGAAQWRAFGRLAGLHPQTVTRFDEQSDAMVAMLRALRHGRMSDVVMHYVSSTVGGMGSSTHLDARKRVNAALFANNSVNVNNVHWLLGPQAFGTLPNRRARLLNHVATVMELVGDLLQLDANETHVYDMVMMLDLPPTSDELRFQNLRQILRLTNPAVWDMFYDLLVNNMNHARPEKPWLKPFVHVSGGPLGRSVLMGEVLATVASRIATQAKTAPTAESVVMTVKPKVTSTQGKPLGNDAIYQTMRDGNLAGLLTIMDVKNVEAGVEVSFSLGGAPITLDTLLTLPPAVTSAEIATRIATLTAVLEEASRLHREAVAMREQAEKDLDQSGQGAYGKLVKLATAMSARAGNTIAALLSGELWEGAKVEIFRKKDKLGAEVRTLLRSVATARENLAKAEAVIALLESPGNPDQSLIAQVRAGLEKLRQTTATSGRTLSALAATSIVSSAASGLVSHGLVALVDDLVRRGRTLEEIQYEVWQAIKRQPVTLEQLGTLLGVRPDRREVAVTLARLFDEAQGKALYWSNPVLAPWLKVILTPNIDRALLVELQKELEVIIPGLQLWVDTDGDGESIGFAFALAHGVSTVAEVVPQVWITDVLPKLEAPEEKAGRTFLDRPFPTL